MTIPETPDIPIDDAALEKARRHVEDVLIEMRDERMFMIAGNGLVVREKDSSPSEVIRLPTREGLRIGIRAYLAALAEDNPRGGHAERRITADIPEDEVDGHPSGTRKDAR